MMTEVAAFEATIPAMPEISRFLGIEIAVPFAGHEPPNFHARYGGHTISVGILDGRVTGRFPARALALVLEWRLLHEAELLDNWHRARDHRSSRPVAPLE